MFAPPQDIEFKAPKSGPPAVPNMGGVQAPTPMTPRAPAAPAPATNTVGRPALNPTAPLPPTTAGGGIWDRAKASIEKAKAGQAPTPIDSGAADIPDFGSLASASAKGKGKPAKMGPLESDIETYLRRFYSGELSPLKGAGFDAAQADIFRGSQARMRDAIGAAETSLAGRGVGRGGLRADAILGAGQEAAGAYGSGMANLYSKLLGTEYEGKLRALEQAQNLLELRKRPKGGGGGAPSIFDLPELPEAPIFF